MNALIHLQSSVIGTSTIQTCNARDLHKFLEVQHRFNDWINNRIEEYGFEEGKDYIGFTENLVKPQGGRPAKEYAISLDMAKELSMVERTEKGKQARQYFIECERRAKAGGQIKETQTLAPSKQAKEALSVMERAFRTLHKLGFDKNSAILSANQYTRKHAQIDVLADSGNTHLIAENQTNLVYTPTELGQQLNGLSAIKVNKLLEATGLQKKIAGHWQPTKVGLPFARLLDTQKQHSNGTLIQQIKWADSVLPVLQVA